MNSTSDPEQHAQSSPPAQSAHPNRQSSLLVLLRAAFHVIAIVSVTTWGFIEWPLPFPGILTGIGFLVLSVLVWALFLSPRPVLRTDRFGQALVELLLLAAAVGAMLSFGIFWVWAGLFGIAAAAVGYLISARAR